MFAMDGFLDKSQPTVFKNAGVDSRFLSSNSLLHSTGRIESAFVSSWLHIEEPLRFGCLQGPHEPHESPP